MVQVISAWKIREVKRGKWEEVMRFWMEMLPPQLQGKLAVT